MSRQKALIVDDEPDIRELLEITLGRMKLDTRSARNVKEARELLAREPFDLCLTDMRLPDGSGLDLVQYIQQRHPQTPVAMITAYGSLDTAIQALKAGAFDFLTKPVDLGRLRELVATALRLRNPEAEEAPVDNRLLGESPPMRALRNQIGKLARSQDLYYRLNVIELRVPPLRERREDIPLLADRILKRLAGDTGLPAARLTGDAQEKLKNYRFPGNVRELENMLERAYTLCEDDQIQPHDLRLADAPGASQEGAASLSEIDNLEDYLEDIERKLIMQALEETRWNRTAAAQRLGLTFRSMRYRLKKLGID
ncbi:TPA: sigma-54-dependent Fis family transcriptional regulator [Pseudomonas aeruginosa]|nr:sigma-54-dependent Fis family transcriptional regulator [Pseudomonas aeruginosa]